MQEIVIPRSETQIDARTFERMFHLCYGYPWLREKSKAFAELWNMADNEQQKNLIELMLSRFRYIGVEQEDRELCPKIAVQIVEKWKLLPDNTIITATCGDSKPDGSQRVVQNIKNKFEEWPEECFYNNIVDAAHHLTADINVVVVDDFIGTGNTVERKIKYLRNMALKAHCEIQVKVITQAMMKFAAEKIQSLGVDFFACVELEKGIDDIPDTERREEARKAMEQLEAKLHPTRPADLDRFRFGYQNSQALYALGDQNVPNNVFPIFWWKHDHNGQIRETIFKRIL